MLVIDDIHYVHIYIYIYIYIYIIVYIQLKCNNVMTLLTVFFWFTVQFHIAHVYVLQVSSKFNCLTWQMLPTYVHKISMYGYTYFFILTW